MLNNDFGGVKNWILVLVSIGLLAACSPKTSEQQRSSDSEADVPVDNFDNQTNLVANQETEFTMEPGKIYAGTAQTSLSGQVSYLIETSAQYGIVEVNEKRGYFEYYSVNLSASDSFTIAALNDKNEKQLIHYTVRFRDYTQPKVMTTYPSDKAIQIAGNTRLQVTFDDIMLTESIVLNEGTTCAGNIQVSADDFITCVPIKEMLTDDQQLFTFTFAEPLLLSAQYQIRINDSITNYMNLPLVQTSEISFFTALDRLVISEVGRSRDGAVRWLELYNPSGKQIALENYSIKTQAIHSRTGEIKDNVTFDLPDTRISPGQYLVFRTGNGKESLWNNFQKLSKKNFFPFWENAGYLALLHNEDNKVLDYIAFGDNKYIDERYWNDLQSAGALTVSGNQNYFNISRYSVTRDTDGHSDWQAQIISPGLPNDMTCVDDSDFDGLPDCSEQPGTTYGGIDLYALGARVGNRDMFVEIDYMQSEEPGLIPQREALEKVTQAFAKNGITIHFDVGGLYGAEFNLGGGNAIPYVDRIKLESNVNTDKALGFYDVKRQYLDNGRRTSFYYMVFGSKQNRHRPSGKAEIFGNDALITFGDWNLSTLTTARYNQLVNYQASTIMHELGHNLGLRHGGDENENEKVNYLSVMNYLYHLNGLPTIGDNEGDRYYARFYDDKTCWGSNTLSNGPEKTSFIIDFSNGLSADYHVDRSSEAAGLGRAQSSPVDFNCDGDVNDIVTASDIPDSDRKVTKDHDDWSNIRFFYAEKLSTLSLFRTSRSTVKRASKITSTLFTDYQEVSEEPGMHFH